MVLFSSCGSAGHIKFYDFVVSKRDAKKELVNVINSNGYLAPAHWNNYELGETKEDIFIYFKKEPKELYVVGFNDYGDNPDYKDKTVLALVGIFDGKTWKYASDLSWSEEKRMNKRFQTEILSKMKFSYTEE